MRIYKWKRLKFNLSLADGGSLVADTTYYVFGWLCAAPADKISNYYDAVGPRSEIKNITTSSTQKTININWWIDGDITGFEDAGGGQVRVLSPEHCMDTGNAVNIQSGTYAGNKIITWESYNTFLITATYVDNYTTTWKCESFNYPINLSRGIRIWMYPDNPTDTDGRIKATFGGISPAYWVNPIYTQNGYTTNPIVRNTCVQLNINVNHHWVERWEKEFNYLNDYGWPLLYGDEVTLTVANIYAEMTAAKVNEFHEFNSRSIRFIGYICFPNWVATLDSLSMVIYKGNITMPNVTIQRGTVIQKLSTTRQIASFNIIDSAFHQDAPNTNDAIPISVSGTNRYLVGFNMYLNSGQVWDGYNFIIPSTCSYMMIAYPTSSSVWKNSYMKNGYIYWITASAPSNPENRFFDNIYLESDQIYDIQNYNYNNDDLIFKCDNVDTPRTDNVKKIYYTSPKKASFYFYRKGTMVFKENETLLQGVNVKITDEENTEYNYVSDEFGEVNFVVQEQRSIPNETAYSTDTLIKGFTVDISRAGYITMKLTSDWAKDFDKDIQLSKIGYIDQKLTGVISMKKLNGTVIQKQQLIGTIVQT